jgi:hypothetical protein
LLIKIFGRTYPSCDDYWDGNWLSSDIHISSGAFTGHITNDVYLRTNEFESFLTQIEPLCESLKGTAEYASLEQQIELRIRGDGSGRFTAEGFVIDKHCEGNKLNFSIHFDQSNLPQTISNLKELLEKYPVVG